MATDEKLNKITLLLEGLGSKMDLMTNKMDMFENRLSAVEQKVLEGNHSTSSIMERLDILETILPPTPHYAPECSILIINLPRTEGEDLMFGVNEASAPTVIT